MAITQLMQFKLSTIKRRPPITMAVTQQLIQFKSLITIQRRVPITMAVTQQLMQFKFDRNKEQTYHYVSHTTTNAI